MLPQVQGRTCRLNLDPRSLVPTGVFLCSSAPGCEPLTSACSPCPGPPAATTLRHLQPHQTQRGCSCEMSGRRGGEKGVWPEEPGQHLRLDVGREGRIRTRSRERGLSQHRARRREGVCGGGGGCVWGWSCSRTCSLFQPCPCTGPWAGHFPGLPHERTNTC